MHIPHNPTDPIRKFRWILAAKCGLSLKYRLLFNWSPHMTTCNKSWQLMGYPLKEEQQKHSSVD